MPGFKIAFVGSCLANGLIGYLPFFFKAQLQLEGIDDVTPADKYYGRDPAILKKREKVRTETMKMRRELNRLAMLEPLPNGVS